MAEPEIPKIIFTQPSESIARALILWEAIHSVALEHPDDCDCTACQAAGGDQEAFGRILIAAAGPPDG
jgi:hypothetical protein